MKTKLLFVALLVANGLLFGLLRGYFGPGAGDKHEPQRLTQQVQPEVLQLLPANSPRLVAPVRAQAAPVDIASDSAAAPAVVPAPPAVAQAPVAPSCIEVGNFTAADARRFSGQLASLNLGDKLVQKLTQDVTSHMVYIPPQDGREGAERRTAELRRLGIADFYVIPDSFPNPALRGGVSLGIFRTEDAAKAYVGQLIAKGMRSARIIARRSRAGKQVFQLRDLTTEARGAVDRIKAGFPEQEIRACAA